jgi:hypothetical protein
MDLQKHGQFLFDHGTITVNGDCEDIINVTGDWTFTDNETKIKLVAKFSTDDPTDTFNEELAHATIKSISATQMVVEDGDGFVITFSPK